MMHKKYGLIWPAIFIMITLGMGAALAFLTGSRYESIRLVLLSVVIITCKRLFVKSAAETASGSIVMAIGIFVNGALHRIPVLDQTVGKDVTLFLLFVWGYITLSFIRSYRNGTFYERHLANPIASFALGTWIAGTSVLGVAISQRFPDFHLLVYGMAIANTILWIFFLKKSIANLMKIISMQSLQKRVHGVLLLATVSTQSIVVLYSALFSGPAFIVFSRGMIILGIGLYIIGFVLIVNRYARIREWSIADDWQNTNCIIHGAMSITGLASCLSGAVSPNLVFLIWIWVLSWFIIVETIELMRGVMRIKLYGAVKGIGTHHMTQWSRNFTFGMLYAFTLNFDLSQTALSHHAMVMTIYDFILTHGAWIVLILLLNQWLLYVKAYLRYDIVEWLDERLKEKAS